MLELLAGVGGGVVSTVFGGITGVVDKHMTNKHNLAVLAEKGKQKDKENQQAIDLAEKEGVIAERQIELNNKGELAIAVAKGKTKVTVAESEERTAEILADAQAKKDSYKHDNLLSKAKKGWVNAYRSLMRPLTTTYAILYSSAMAMIAWLSGNQEMFIMADGTHLFIYIAVTFCHLMVYCTSWWFASRGKGVLDGIDGTVKGK